MANKIIKLEGHVFITFDIEAVTGLHIGGSDTGIEIGGVDKTVIRDRRTNRPYIPGSSLKGKMRSLLEKYNGKVQNRRIGQGYIHTCDQAGDYAGCSICRVYGVPGELDFGTPTRLVVRDVQMKSESAVDLEKTARTDLPYTEVKVEVSIDRVTSAANPRQMERVPAGVRFGPVELVFSVYSGDGCNPQADVAHLQTVIEGMQLLEDDYLGGLGSRGSGKVKLHCLQVSLRGNGNYLAPPQAMGQSPYLDLAGLVADLSTIQSQIRTALKLT